MVKQAEVEPAVGRNGKGHRNLERQTLTTPPKIVHPMEKTLDEIRLKWKPAWKSNLVDMNMDDYYEDAPAELFYDSGSFCECNVKRSCFSMIQ
uniref:Uncharacterized protein n=1 Tax=Romanomermis culicivorax TaxID=13658 RepID=A0A915J6E3_ROMCU